jgi:hypothetical protein
MIKPMAMAHANTMANKPAPTSMAYFVPPDTHATPNRATALDAKMPNTPH